MVDLIDTNGVKPTLKKGVLGYDDYNAGGDAGRLYVGTGTASIAQAKKSEVDAKVGKVTSTDNAIVRFNGTTGDVQNSAITIDDNGNLGSGAQSFNGFGGSGFKNYVRNGCFRIWQRGTVINNVQDTNYTADGWAHTRNGSGATINIQQGSWSAGSTETGVGTTQNNILEFVQTVAGTGCSFNTINQRIEGVQWSSQKTLTLSFNCEFLTSADTLPAILIRQHFGIGGSASVDTVIATNIPVNATSDWDKKSFTFTLPSISGKTVGTSPCTEVIIFLPVNKVQQFRLANVQLEQGSVATPFEQRPYGLELSLCQRYCFNPKFGADWNNQVVRGDAYGVDNINGWLNFKFPVSMRIAPYMSLSSGVSQLSLGYPEAIPLTSITQTIISCNEAIYAYSVASGNTAYKHYNLYIPNSTNQILFIAEL